MITIVNVMMTMRKHKKRLYKRFCQNYCYYESIVLLVIIIVIVMTTMKKHKKRNWMRGPITMTAIMSPLCFIMMMSMRMHKNDSKPD